MNIPRENIHKTEVSMGYASSCVIPAVSLSQSSAPLVYNYKYNDITLLPISIGLFDVNIFQTANAVSQNIKQQFKINLSFL